MGTSVEALDLCQVLRPKNTDNTKASHLRWFHFRGLGKDQGLDKLPPTQGALNEHIRRAHNRCSIWVQALLFQPIVRPPNELGLSLNATWWQYIYMPILIRTPIVPYSILQLIRCTCSKSHCVGQCSCRQHDNYVLYRTVQIWSRWI